MTIALVWSKHRISIPSRRQLVLKVRKEKYNGLPELKPQLIKKKVNMRRGEAGTKRLVANFHNK